MLEPDRDAADREGAGGQRRADRASSTSSTGTASTPTIVAAGGLGTWDITGANPRITEIHAGSYIFSDAFHRNLVPGFDPALTVLATVISRHGDLAVLDCGRKSIGIDRTPPEVVSGEGVHPVRVRRALHPRGAHRRSSSPPDSRLAVGDRVELMPGYAPTTANFYDCYHVVEDGVIVDVWPILARYGSATAGVGPYAS